MAVAAELVHQADTYPDTLGSGEPAFVVVASELDREQMVRHRAARFIGSVLTAREVSHEQQPLSPEALEGEKFRSLSDALQAAASGNRLALKQVTACVKTDVLERAIKSGLIIDVELEVDENNTTRQYGQSDDEIHANALVYASDKPQIRARTEAEIRNKFRITDWLNSDQSDETNFVVVSRTPDDMSSTELSQAGFFTDTMSCVFQVLSKRDGHLLLQSAFVAGVPKWGGERHDEQAVIKFAAGLGIDYQGMTTTEILDSPMIISKKLMPNGPSDLVMRYDEAIDGPAFFGEARPAGDYVGYRNTREKWEESFEPRVREILQNLLLEADTLRMPLDAVRRLHQLSEFFMLEQAVIEAKINPRVFGPTAAYHIEQARYHQALGNLELATAAIRLAHATAKSSSCPTAWLKQSESTSNIAEQLSVVQADEAPEAKPPDTIRCIKCRQESPKKEVISKSTWRCPHCKYEIDICSGEVKHYSEPPNKAARLRPLIHTLDTFRKDTISASDVNLKAAKAAKKSHPRPDNPEAATA